MECNGKVIVHPSDDFTLPKFQALHLTLNRLQQRDQNTGMRYWRVKTAMLYFEYAVALVQFHEQALAVPPEEHEHPARVAGPAIAAYGHMKAVLDLYDRIVHGIRSTNLRLIRKRYGALHKETTELRDRLAAHPDEDAKQSGAPELYVMRAPHGWCDDGRVWIGQYGPLMTEPRTFLLEPRSHLERLRICLEESAPAIEETL